MDNIDCVHERDARASWGSRRNKRFGNDQTKKTILEAYTMYPTINPLTSTPFNWLDFYKYISLSGLNETSCFKVDFPKDTDARSLLNQYINAGKIELYR